MAAQAMVSRGTSVRRIARQMGVTEGALRYRLKKRAQAEQADGRARKRTSVDGYEEAVEAILERLGDARVSGGAGRPAQARLVYEALARDHGYTGSYRAGATSWRGTRGTWSCSGGTAAFRCGCGSTIWRRGCRAERARRRC